MCDTPGCNQEATQTMTIPTALVVHPMLQTFELSHEEFHVCADCKARFIEGVLAGRHVRPATD